MSDEVPPITDQGITVLLQLSNDALLSSLDELVKRLRVQEQHAAATTLTAIGLRMRQLIGQVIAAGDGRKSPDLFGSLYKRPCRYCDNAAWLRLIASSAGLSVHCDLTAGGCGAAGPRCDRVELAVTGWNVIHGR